MQYLLQAAEAAHCNHPWGRFNFEREQNTVNEFLIEGEFVFV